ncbi:MAG: toprim domain-containing protein, partial [Methanosarcina sp.]|nr:toprim domain-containing protein [Methanosarcina sp.]
MAGGLKMSSADNRDKVDEIKDGLDIVDVIGKSVNLHHIGGNEYAGTVGTAGHSGESLKVDKDGQVWNDFKNGKGGDVFDWIGNINGLDARGADFPEVLRIAADLAGVELEEMTEEERGAAKEKADIHNLFTAAAEVYHKNLTPELYDYILQKWGITRETVDRFKIGYANTGRNLKELDNTTLKKSGLVYVNGGMTGGEVFQGRIIFPYWKNGKVVYLIGRETEETPETEREKGMKYKKLLVHKEGREYVSSSVQNSYFYGEDSLRGSDYCIITEGVADCISMLQAGFPCISPVTVQFREKDNPKLISLTKGLNKVYICNDNEGNKAGLKGALSTAEALESAGIEARLIILPKPEGIDKIDIADYMKDHNKTDFETLMESSSRLWDFKLNQLEIKDSSTSMERLHDFRIFISNDLQGMDLLEWEIFINNEVAKKFRLTKRDIKTTIEGCKRERFRKQIEANEQEYEQENNPEDKDRLKEYPEEIRELAYQILKEGDAFNFILETWNLRHVGDRNIGENCLCAVASTYILNTRGLHVKPSGESGKGKSDAIETVLTLLPEHKYISGSMSSKSLYYHPGLKEGTIVYSDDANFTDDTIATLKQSTSNFQTPSKHRTVVNQEYAEYSIPERCSFWFSTVDGIPDEQLANRFLNADVDGSREQDMKVYNHIKESELNLNLPVDDDVLICRCIFDILDKERYLIKIPYINAIEWTNIENRRNFPKFLDILRSVTFFNAMQRENINGYYLSDIEDFYKALDIYKGTSKNNATNLTDLEIKVLKHIESKGPVTLKNLMSFLEVSRTRVIHILHGKDGKGGMFAKVPQLNKIDQSKTDDNKTTTRENLYEYNGPKLGFEIYDSVAKIDNVKAEEEREEFIKKLLGESVTTVTQCNPSITHERVILK